MGSVLGSIFGFGDKLKRRLKDAVSNPSDYSEMTADENRNEWRKNPDERSMGFFNPVPLGTMGNFVLRKGLQDAVEGGTNLSRREFMKKSAGLAGGTAAASIPGAKLLQKFAPEERVVAREVVAEAAPKYKYNSLKEYLDDAEMWAKEDFKATEFERMAVGPDHGSLPMTRQDFLRERLLQDEQAHNTAKFFYKDNLKDPTTGKWIDPYTGQPHSEEFLKNIRNTTDDFSPQAKKEMKNFKQYIKDNDYRWLDDLYKDPRIQKDDHILGRMESQGYGVRDHADLYHGGDYEAASKQLGLLSTSEREAIEMGLHNKYKASSPFEASSDVMRDYNAWINRNNPEFHPDVPF